MILIPPTPKAFDDSFEHPPVFWDVEFGFEVSDDFVIKEPRITARVFRTRSAYNDIAS